MWERVVSDSKKGVSNITPLSVILISKYTEGGSFFGDTKTRVVGVTDFRRQITGLSAMVSMKFRISPFDGTSVFVFCNKRRDAIKVLRYDRNGFVLAHKKLLENMKFQWPMKEEDVKLITPQQMEWLLDGLPIEQKKGACR